ncbi:hypothetical protein K1719_030986 [Acacia pycnantha]|nr:hypothetical protein K1719_030986 [Acacia pycnantha]
MVLSNKKMLSHNLIEDLMIEIIVRLPVKSLLRFKCVAKSWYERDVWRIILWNLSTKWVKAIPRAPHQPNGIYYPRFGFGLDPITNDYKIIRFPFLKGKDEKLIVEVYNLSTDSWRIIDVDAPMFEFYYPCSGCYFNGAFHCLTVDLHMIDKFILIFDFSKEVFGILRGPPLVVASFTEAFLTIADKSLVCVATYYLNPKFCVDIWVMNEYGVESSWTKKFEIEPFPKLNSVLGFWGDNEMLVDDDTDQLILHDLQNQQRQRFQIYLQRARMMDYCESLVPKLA